MKLKSLIKQLTISLGLGIASTMIHLPSDAQSNRARFYCGTYQGYPATIAGHPTRGNIPLLVWRTTDFGSSFSPQKRCDIISQKFEINNQNGTLQYIVEGRARNGATVLCASRSKKTWLMNPCPDSQILMTLRRGIDDPREMIKHLAEMNREVSSVDPLNHSGVMQTSSDNQFIRLSMGHLMYFSQD